MHTYDLLGSSQFIALANIVTTHKVANFVQLDAYGSITGLEAAMRLNLHAYVRDPKHAAALARAYPMADVYDGDSASFLREVLPQLAQATVVYIDPNSDTFASDEQMILEANGTQEWFILHSAPIRVRHPESDHPGSNLSLGN